MVTYGKYHVLRPLQLFKGNQSLEDFESQTWVKVNFWEGVWNPQSRQFEWWPQVEWMPEVEAVDIVKRFVKQAEDSGILYAIGNKAKRTRSLTMLTGLPVVAAEKILDVKTDTENFARIQYSVRAKGQCVIV
jgi:hypothetical protein